MTEPPRVIRLTFDIDESTWMILKKNIPYGMRKYIYRSIIEGLACKFQQDRVGTIAAILTKTWGLEETLSFHKEGA